jgi:hypothetical protein
MDTGKFDIMGSSVTLYASLNIIMVINSRRMRWVEHVALMEEMRNAYIILAGFLKGKYHSEDVDVDDRIILEWILGKQGGKVWTEFI